MSYEKPGLASKHFDDLFNSLPSLEGKTIIITGTTSGTGFVAANACGKLGAKLLLLNRPSARADAALGVGNLGLGWAERRAFGAGDNGVGGWNDRSDEA